MSRKRTSEELLQDRITAMGDELGHLHHDLWNEVSNLTLEWKEFRNLYTPERIDLLNSTAGGFFRMHQRATYRQLLVGICRIADPPGKGNRENITIQRYRDLVPGAHRESVALAVSGAVEATKDICVHRNKRVAHWDLNVARGVVPIPNLSFWAIETALRAVAGTVNQVGHIFGFSETPFHETLHGQGVASLVTYLERGWREYEQDRERKRGPVEED